MADRITQQNKTYIEDGSTSKKIGIDAPAGVPADWTFTLPATDGTAGQILKTDGNGNTDWIDAAYDPAGSAATVQSNLDTHTGNTSNPHSTTKAQVGLSNVTDDAQLKRADGDINSFTEKTSPTGDDILLLEDSEASFAKKKAKISSIAGSGVNYIKATDGGSIGLWATYADAAGTSPVDGTGGSPSVTFAVSTDSSMRGTSNFLFAHDNVNRQGEGFSYLCNIDPSDRGKVIRFNFEYLVASGTYADGGLTVWFYDVTNGQVIQGAPTSILNSSLIERFQSEVQVPITCAQMRVIVHVTTSTATAYTMRFENFSFGPSEKNYGSQISGWVAAPELTLTNVTGTYITREKRRVGDSMQYSAKVSLTAAVSGTIDISFGGTIDNSKISDASLGAIVGIAWALDAGTAARTGMIMVNSATTVRINGDNVTSSWDATRPFTWASGDAIAIEFTVPLVGMSASSQVVSDEYSGRVVAGHLFKTGNTHGTTTDAVVTWAAANVVSDTHGMFSDADDALVIKEAGYYCCSALASMGTSSGFKRIQILVDGVGYAANSFDHGASGITANATASFNGVFLNVGQKITVTARSATSATGDVRLTLTKSQGPSQVLAGETIACAYYCSTNNVLLANNKVNFDSKDYDTHNMVVTGSGWYFKPPVAGLYEIIVQYRSASAQTTGILVWKNGSALTSLTTMETLGRTSAVVIPLVSTDQVDIRPAGNNTFQGGLTTADSTSKIFIRKVGNS